MRKYTPTTITAAELERAEARKRFMDLCDEPYPDAELCGDALRRCVELHADASNARLSSTTIAAVLERAMRLGAAAREAERTEARLADEAAEERDQLLFGPSNVFKPGDVVVLTATACRIWATVMGFPVTRSLTAVWTVTACDCDLCTHGSFVCTDEPIEPELGHVSNDNVGTAALRHVSVGQLKRKGELRADDGLSTGPAQPALGPAIEKARRRR